MIKPKSDKEVDIMIRGGKKLGKILDELLTMAQPGVILSDIEEKACDLIEKAGGAPSFKTVEGYKWATCICINEEVVHGIPTKYAICENDLVTIDIGMIFEGFHTDTAYTILCSSDKQTVDSFGQFLQTGKKALQEAIKSAVPGNRIFDISHAIENEISACGYSPVKSLVGHGIGRNLHEPPQVPCFTQGEREKTTLLKENMTLAIEVIYAESSGSVVYGSDDGWTISTKDGLLSAVFEHTVLISEKPLVLTVRPSEMVSDNR